jgi:type IV pilus assembly protein PilO
MKTSLLLVARGDGPQLLAFLRRLESLSLLVVQSNLQVKAEQKGTAKDGMSRPALRINLGLYSLAPKVQAVKQAVKR